MEKENKAYNNLSVENLDIITESMENFKENIKKSLDVTTTDFSGDALTNLIIATLLEEVERLKETLVKE